MIQLNQLMTFLQLTTWSSSKMWAAVSFSRGPYFCPPTGSGQEVLWTSAPPWGTVSPNRSQARTNPGLVIVARCRSHKSGRRWRSAQKITASLTFGTNPDLVNMAHWRSHQCQASAPFGASATKDKINRALK